MSAEIYIISGFLGAGKTTLIQKLLKDSFKNQKVILIENDFGEISVDAALLKSGGIEVKEINSGCICCNLSGDFVKAFQEILDRFNPDKIIIEPSGVGKLSDITKACSDLRILPRAKIKAKITVADVKRCKMYLDNFGEFFEDQIQNADIILLSHTEKCPDKINDVYKLIRTINMNSPILTEAWSKLTSAEILNPEQLPNKQEASSLQKYDCGAHHHGTITHAETYRCRHTDHDDNCEYGHNHYADGVFDTITIQIKHPYTIEDLKTRFLNMEHNKKGTILRAKGIVPGPGGYVNLQYIPGNLQITSCTARGNMLCIIGQNLSRQELISLFSRE